MSSLFTFNSDPSPPSSPWSSALATPTGDGSLSNTRSATPNTSRLPSSNSSGDVPLTVTSLMSEPQNGSTEYKQSLLHPSPARLQHLTTQMLWRLQQSCPTHNTAGLVKVPSLSSFEDTAEDETVSDKSYYAALLQDSQGCFYEIGVADDGKLLGLVQEDLDKSLNTLNKMADALGCRVEVVRRVMVGHKFVKDELKQLFVAEARVSPFQFNAIGSDTQALATQDFAPPQLRVVLTGPSASGKSSLVGTLTTSTNDNGRGKSRLSLLKHRHEIATGITSSIANELIGFTRNGDLINYRTANVDSWMDIHAAVGPRSVQLQNQEQNDARTVLLLDSAGMYRYRRTAIRGMIGWAPHYTAIVIASDTDMSETGTNSALEYLTLCLKLKLRFFLIINKLDIAKSQTLKAICKLVFDKIRRAGLEPKAIQESIGGVSAKQFLASNANNVLTGAIVPVLFVSAVSGKGVDNLLALLGRLPVPCSAIPSTVQANSHESFPHTLYHVEEIFEGLTTGIDLVVAGHVRYGRIAMGDELLLGPFPVVPSGGWTTPSSSYAEGGKWGPRSVTPPSDKKLLDDDSDKSDIETSEEESIGEWRVAKVTSIRKCRLPVGALNAGEVGTIGIIWAKESEKGNIDNLSSQLETTYLSPMLAPIPTKTSKSVSFVASPSPIPTPHIGVSADSRVRKGMVLMNKSARPVISTGFVAEFSASHVSLPVGCTVIVYFGSVRAAARVVSFHQGFSPSEHKTAPSTDSYFNFDDGEDHGVSKDVRSDIVMYTFRFLNTIEWIENHTTVLVTDTGRFGSENGTANGLGDGIVGKIVEVEE